MGRRTKNKSSSSLLSAKEQPKHSVCRSSNENQLVTYDNCATIQRMYIPDEKVPWTFPWEEYKPLEYTNPKFTDSNKPNYADLQDARSIEFNKIEKDQEGKIKVNRETFIGTVGDTKGKYDIEKGTGRPINPMGRTGVRGRGNLGKWGPNHAADPIVTRWKRDENGKKVFDKETNKPILQFAAILRKKTEEWAIPGGMFDPGETVSGTLKREFLEEAMSYLEDNNQGKKESSELTEEQKKEKDNKIKTIINEFFKNGREIYKGYVDDPRNTDNSWMETQVYNFHDKKGKKLGKFKLKAGSDAKNSEWMDISSKIKLYASHKDFIQQVVKIYNAHW